MKGCERRRKTCERHCVFDPPDLFCLITATQASEMTAHAGVFLSVEPNCGTSCSSMWSQMRMPTFGGNDEQNSVRSSRPRKERR